MKKMLIKTARQALNRMGVQVNRYEKYPADFADRHMHIWDAVSPYTMTSQVRVRVLIDAVRYLVSNNIEGAFVECGVWKGGSSMAMALALKDMDVQGRDVFLYDTFSGMSAPTDDDVSSRWGEAKEQFVKTKITDDTSDWCNSPLKDVRRNVLSTGYPSEKFHFIEGKVEDTIPASAPEKIALLRLDTDWYESTKHEMTHLFPRLASKGILIIDDYSCWDGARKAIDEYMAEHNLRMFLSRVDSDACIAVKP